MNELTHTHRYGQLSGMVEPIAGLIGVVCVTWIEPLLPYAMAFAAGAMIYVVCDDLIPEAASRYIFSSSGLKYRDIVIDADGGIIADVVEILELPVRSGDSAVGPFQSSHLF